MPKIGSAINQEFSLIAVPQQDNMDTLYLCQDSQLKMDIGPLKTVGELNG